MASVSFRDCAPNHSHAVAPVLCAGYSAAYAQLHNAAKPERDALPDVTDAKADLAARLGALAASAPGRLPRLVAAHVSVEQQQMLVSIMLAAGVSLS